MGARRHLLTPIPDRGELERPRLESGFLPDFALDALLGRLVHVGPAARECPAAIAYLAHQQNPVIAEYGPAHVHLWRWISDVLLKQLGEPLEGCIGTVRQHLDRDGADTAEAVEIVGVLGEGQAALRDGLQLAGPQEPLRFSDCRLGFHQHTSCRPRPPPPKTLRRARLAGCARPTVESSASGDEKLRSTRMKRTASAIWTGDLKSG